jgi:DNA polymerase-3 subunit alpha
MAKEPSRTRQYLRYLIHKGAIERYGLPLDLYPDRKERVEYELSVIEKAGFSSYFIILASIMDFCRRENIPYGPGRGSVGGCYVAFLCGIHEVDSLKWDLLFERFLTEDRVSYPDVDLDFSQVHRHRVIEFVRQMGVDNDMAVLQVGAFQRSGGRGTINNMLSAMRETTPNADEIAYTLRNCLPAKGSITGGQKVERELEWWKENGHGDKDEFLATATKAGWWDRMTKIDGMYTGLTRHAAGVVILSKKDEANIPKTSTNGVDLVTGFDMYSLDELDYLKYDILGLRTLDVIADAHKFAGGSGATRDLLEIWDKHKDDKEPYQILCEGDTLGIFQMETEGYRRTLKEFLPDCFDHIVQLNALYRPGALDYRRESDDKNMVEVFIERRHRREVVTFPTPELSDILHESHGIFLYQEQAMRACVELAGFDGKQADQLRKGIGKKRVEIIDALKPKFIAGCIDNGIKPPIPELVWKNIEAAGRYSWNKAHAVEYAIITWLTLWFKYNHPAAFYCALFNSYSEDKEKLAVALAEARQRVKIAPPDVNLAQDGFTVTDGKIVFGFSGVKGMGETGRQMILNERVIPFGSYQDFCKRLPSLPMDKKMALIKCGAFDSLDSREILLSSTVKPGKAAKIWTVAEHLNHNRNLKKPRPVPPVWELTLPTEDSLSKGELESIGFYITATPLQDVVDAMSRMPDGHFGGRIEKIYRKVDKRGGEYANFTILTPALTKQRCRIFASNWPTNSWIEEGMSVVIRGRMDGETIIADAIFKTGDVRHFRKIKVTRNDTQSIEPFDGNMETIRSLEKVGYEVRLLNSNSQS